MSKLRSILNAGSILFGLVGIGFLGYSVYSNKDYNQGMASERETANYFYLTGLGCLAATMGLIGASEIHKDSKSQLYNLKDN